MGNRTAGVDYDIEVAEKFSDILKLLGLDITDPQLKDTPERWAAFMQEFTSYTDDNIYTTFPSSKPEQAVAFKDIAYHSICAHHFLPFYGKASIAYLTTDRMIGASKLPRIVKMAGRKPQSQETMGQEILELVMQITGSQHVAVVLYDTVHTCMTMRGIEAHGTLMTTSALSERVQHDDGLKNEFYRMMGQ